MMQRLIGWSALILSVGILAACEPKPTDTPSPKAAEAVDDTVPDRVLGLAHYRAHPKEVGPTIAWCRTHSPEKRTSAQNRNCKDASHAKMQPVKPGTTHRTYQGFRGGTL